MRLIYVFYCCTLALSETDTFLVLIVISTFVCLPTLFSQILPFFQVLSSSIKYFNFFKFLEICASIYGTSGVLDSIGNVKCAN